MKRVAEYLKTLGIRPNLRGYVFISESVDMIIKGDVTSGLLYKYGFFVISKKHKTTPVRIERAVRHAICSSWDRYPDRYAKLLGFEYRPNLSEFLFELAETIRNEIESDDQSDLTEPIKTEIIITTEDNIVEFPA